MIEEAVTDERLLHDARTDPDAFTRFYRRHAASLLGHLVRRTGDPELGADLTAQTFACTLEGIERFDPERGSGVNWLFGFARHQLLRTLQRGYVERRARDRLGMGRLELDDEALERILALADSESTKLRLADALDALPPDQRAALDARVLDEADYSDIARASGTAEATIRKLVSRALESLRHGSHDRLPGPARGRAPRRRRAPRAAAPAPPTDRRAQGRRGGRGRGAGRDRHRPPGQRHRRRAGGLPEPDPGTRAQDHGRVRHVRRPRAAQPPLRRLRGFFWTEIPEGANRAEPSLGTAVLYRPSGEELARQLAFTAKIDEVRPLTEADEKSIDRDLSGADVVVVYGPGADQQLLDDPDICVPGNADLKLCPDRADERRYSVFVLGDRPLTIEPVDERGWWSWAALSPDGQTILAQWQADCPRAFAIDAGTGERHELGPGRALS